LTGEFALANCEVVLKYLNLMNLCYAKTKSRARNLMKPKDEF